MCGLSHRIPAITLARVGTTVIPILRMSKLRLSSTLKVHTAREWKSGEREPKPTASTAPGPALPPSLCGGGGGLWERPITGLCARGPESWVSLTDLGPPQPWCTVPVPYSLCQQCQWPSARRCCTHPTPGPTVPSPAAAPAAAATGPAWPCSSDPRPGRQPALSWPPGLLPSGSSQGGCWEGECPPSGGHCHPGPAQPSPPLPSEAGRAWGDSSPSIHHGGEWVAGGWRA